MLEYQGGGVERYDECYRALLTQLPGVFAAGIRMDEENNLREIHILASSERNPKQISRDVQSALFAAYGLDIDHRIISIAQLSENPIQSPPEPEQEPISKGIIESHRLRCKAISHQMDEDGYTIKVVLQHDGQDYEGMDQCQHSINQRLMATVQATINAVHAFFGGNKIYHPVVVQCVQVGGIPVVVTVIEFMEERGSCFLVGSSKQTEDGVVGVVKATLDALNRSIEKIAFSSR